MATGRTTHACITITTASGGSLPAGAIHTYLSVLSVLSSDITCVGIGKADRRRSSSPSPPNCTSAATTTPSTGGLRT